MNENLKSSPERRGKILLIRIDRIGDLVLSLPLDESLTRLGYRPQWWISQGLSFITENARPPRPALEIKKKFELDECLRLLKILRQEKFSAAIIFHAPWWIAAILFLARVPLRVGPKSQWYSFIFFNRGIRQKRSLCEHSELEYNFLLAELGLGFGKGEIGRQFLKLSGRQNFDLKKWSLEKQKYFVVHPGMGGSALNWPTRSYIDLIDQLILRKEVVITGTETDRQFLIEIKKSFSTHPKVKFLDSQLSGDELIYVLQNSSGVLAPSTGVLHLAASTGVRTFGIYSPVKVQRPERWGPQGSQTKVFVPDVDCPGEFQCLKEACRRYNCIETVEVHDILEAMLTP